MMLRNDDYRFAFVSVDGISTLISILSSRVNFQVNLSLMSHLNVLSSDQIFPGAIPAGLLFVGFDIQSTSC